MISYAYPDLKSSEVIKEKLISKGFFPESLSKILSSESFYQYILNKNDKLSSNRYDYSSIQYKLTRHNNSPRTLNIPHPFSYLILTKSISDNWVRINKIIGTTEKYEQISMIVPRAYNKNDRLISMKEYDRRLLDPDILRLNLLSMKRYVVKADISSFYGSIYSHSVAWALVGKLRARNNKGRKPLPWYSEIDRSIRNLQRQETKGIPIGPDTSNIISEIILARIDKKLSKYHYIRHIDDYECFCKDIKEAHNFLKDLSSELSNFSLELNSSKTQILEYPQSFKPIWVNELKNFDPYSIIEVEIITKNKAMQLLDLATDLNTRFIDGSPIKYALKMLSKKSYLNFNDFRKIFLYMTNLCYLYPYTIDIFDDIFNSAYSQFSFEKDLNVLFVDFLTRIITENISSNRSDVLTWGLYLLIKYDLLVDTKSLNLSKLMKTGDSIPILMAYLYSKMNNLDCKYFHNFWIELLSSDNFTRDENWLFLYEYARIENKLGTRDQYLDELLKSRITFLSNEILEKSIYFEDLPF